MLAGDSLLTLAFEAVAGAELPAQSIAKACACLARAAGCAGMVAGQVMDLANENKSASLDEIKKTDLLKTGEMIKAAALLGCIAANAGETQTAAAVRYCESIGLAFQIIDDILDVTANDEVLGKPAGSDAVSGKSTYVSLLGLEKSKETAKNLTQKAKAALEPFGKNGQALCELADKLCERGS